MLTAVKLVVWNVGVTVFLLVIMNVTAALLNRIHITSRAPEIAHETQGREGGFVPYRLRIARKEFHGKQLNMDKDGWRTGKPIGTLFDDWSPENYNVFMVGGSALYGYSVDDHETLPAHLEALERQNGRSKMRVYNLGQMGYAAHDEANVIFDLARQRRIPHVVVFYDGANEAVRIRSMAEDVKKEYVEVDYGYLDVLAFFERGLRTFNPEYLAITEFAGRVRHLVTRLRQRRGAEEIDVELEARLRAHANKAADAYLRNIELVSKLGEAVGFKSLFVLQPLGACLEEPKSYQFPYFGPPRPWQMIYYRALYSEVEAQVQGHPGVSVVNLCRALNESVRRGGRPFNTQIHLNSEGNRYMAEIILDLIKNLRR